MTTARTGLAAELAAVDAAHAAKAIREAVAAAEAARESVRRLRIRSGR